MLNVVDRLLNRITMYRLILYYLIGLLGAAVVLSFTHTLAFDPYALLFTTAVLVSVCWLTNTLFSKTFEVPANAESVYISALILALIITPLQTVHDFWFVVWSGVLAMASKYIVAINRHHIFNPVAFAVALTYLTINQSASWWVGTAVMLPFVLVGGLLIVRKIGRFDLVLSFLGTAAAAIMLSSLIKRENLGTTIPQTIAFSPFLFFAFVILTEPLTMPPTRRLRLAYGALVGLLFAPQLHVGSLYSTPELAILIGNVFSFVVSPKRKLILRLQEKVQLAPDIYDFIFAPTRNPAFAPGQFMEWTIGLSDPDTRGNRRYFTLASSPTEDRLRVGVKFYEHSSTFKTAMLAMDEDSEIVAGPLVGDFVLPRDPRQSCVFIAGGIGITPFRSMIKYLLDTHRRRPILVFYASRSPDEFVYGEILDQARRELGIRTIYTITDTQQVPAGWTGKVGRIDAQMIAGELPTYQDCIFYISGPQSMVDASKEVLHQLGVKSTQIKTDYFAGLA